MNHREKEKRTALAFPTMINNNLNPKTQRSIERFSVFPPRRPIITHDSEYTRYGSQ